MPPSLKIEKNDCAAHWLFRGCGELWWRKSCAWQLFSPARYPSHVRNITSGGSRSPLSRRSHHRFHEEQLSQESLLYFHAVRRLNPSVSSLQSTRKQHYFMEPPRVRQLGRGMSLVYVLKTQSQFGQSSCTPNSNSMLAHMCTAVKADSRPGCVYVLYIFTSTNSSFALTCLWRPAFSCTYVLTLRRCPLRLFELPTLLYLSPPKQPEQ